jgi:V/A-type H+-transporting ATPase subunit I
MSEVAAAIEAIERHVPEKKPMFYPGRDVPQETRESVLADPQQAWQQVTRAQVLEEKFAALRTDENQLQAVADALRPWEGLPLPLEALGTRHARACPGTLPATLAFDKARQDLQAAAPESDLALVRQDAELLYVLAIWHESVEEQAMAALKLDGFARIQFRDARGTAKANVERAEARLRDVAAERAKLEAEAARLAPAKVSMEVLYDSIKAERDRRQVSSRMGRTGRTFCLEGWLPKDRADALAEELAQVAPVYMETSEPKKGEGHPILLKNPAIVRPFEAITAMYSLPSVNDVDPNTVMAPFYFLFFGMMIGDFAYGALLSLAMFLMIRKFKPQGMSGQVMRMLFLGGISTMFWGAMFGSDFGNLPQGVNQMFAPEKYAAMQAAHDALPKAAMGKPGDPMFFGLWFDTLSDPMKLLIFAMILGAIHLFTGMAVKIYMLFRDGKPFEAIFDVASWYLLLVGVVMFGLGGQGAMGKAGLVMTIVGAAMLVLTQGRDKKNPIMKLVGGVQSLYGITGYLGDVLSYSRLLALGLATGVIAQVFNTLGNLDPSKRPNPLSILIFLIILAVGTVFNVAINALGAFVHASRLQYVEFFSKFYEGGGEAFRPLREKPRYTRAQPNGAGAKAPPKHGMSPGLSSAG